MQRFKASPRFMSTSWNRSSFNFEKCHQFRASFIKISNTNLSIPDCRFINNLPAGHDPAGNCRLFLPELGPFRTSNPSHNFPSQSAKKKGKKNGPLTWVITLILSHFARFPGSLIHFSSPRPLSLSAGWMEAGKTPGRNLSRMDELGLVVNLRGKGHNF